MNRTVSGQLFVVALLTGVFAAAPPAAAEEPMIPEPAPELARLRQLAGTWEGTVTHGDEGEAEPAKAVYRVTSAGSAIIETLFADTEHEMVTVYHMDAGQVVMTHYCAIGNQPKMGEQASNDGDAMSFEFIGGSNMNSEDDPHMHAMTIKFLGNDHIQANWTMYADGQPGHTAHIDLHRK